MTAPAQRQTAEEKPPPLSAARPHTWNWEYNTRGELTKAGEAARQWDYAYDTIGNRLRASSTGIQPVGSAGILPATLSYSSNNLNQYTSVSSASSVVKPSYDLDGNLLSDGKHTCVWDAENRLTKITQGKTEITNTFDHLQRRVRKTVRENGQLKSDTAFVYDGWNVLAELNLKTPENTLTYVWGPDLSNTPQGAGGVGGLLAVNHLASQTSLYPVYDGNGNITAWFDKDAKLALTRDYDAFGNIISEATPDGGTLKAKFGGLPYAFSTKPQDAETGWLYYGYRYYAPELGRWPSRDSIGERGGNNLYGMIGNRPNAGIDGLGQETVKVGKCEIVIYIGHGSGNDSTTSDPLVWDVADPSQSAAGAITCFPGAMNSAIPAEMRLDGLPDHADVMWAGETSNNTMTVDPSNSTIENNINTKNFEEMGGDANSALGRMQHPDVEHGMEMAYRNVLHAISSQRRRLCSNGSHTITIRIINHMGG